MKNRAILRGYFSQFLPAGISYFALPVFEHFAGEPLHTAASAGEWDTAVMARENHERLYRSNRVERPEVEENPGRWMRLLFRLEEGVWINLNLDRLTVYASSPEKAQAVHDSWRARYIVEVDVDGNPNEEMED